MSVQDDDRQRAIAKAAGEVWSAVPDVHRPLREVDRFEEHLAALGYVVVAAEVTEGED